MDLANFVKICSSPTNLLLATIFGQTVIMGLAWGFIGGILYTRVLALPDHIVRLIVEYPTVLTLIVTLISTTLSNITSFFFTFAIKEALRHYLSGRSIPLLKLRMAIALSIPTWVLPRSRRYLELAALTLAFYAMATFLSARSALFSMNPMEICLTLVCTVGALCSYQPLYNGLWQCPERN
ncbi:hypothetical protein DFJ58DRAFT_144476 [Suillus subalutaceus]|uniref:uncharacterized protein n=1 Tax=Suillus subalutaceus TaxID=48586 RepID=UPI001B8850DD|nr:uncharacterized protein DFJ58DRAFT_144476 [Suillus subalutaceus]KAG1837654.1 hypothetical protein DFJ58DRAFT_144476 [Suillus subalutaceus]